MQKKGPDAITYSDVDEILSLRRMALKSMEAAGRRSQALARRIKRGALVDDSATLILRELLETSVTLRCSDDHHRKRHKPKPKTVH